MNITSSAFTNGEIIPARFTCQSDNVNPPLSVSDVPAAAAGLALIVDDPDSPNGVFTHWLIWNLPAAAGEIAENYAGWTEGRRGLHDAGAINGVNDFGRVGYGGPCPSVGTHHYHFRLLALDRTTDLAVGADRAAFEAAINGHIIDQAEIVGLYTLA